MKTIPLTQGKIALVDDADYEELAKYHWKAHRRKAGLTFDAMRNIKTKEGWSSVYMHRQLLGLVCGDKRQADHRDGDGLNNQRSNLRICTQAENQHNRNIRQRRWTSSQFKGVHLHRMRWEARIRVASKEHYLGGFSSEIAAALAYNAAAKKYFGEFARINVV